ncbi:MAG: sulfite exporter TauE/SafE family protein [Inquilinus sp.]|nr:sulfite exporter TauE/SafE family protein [Inquilinus sp.]
MIDALGWGGLAIGAAALFLAGFARGYAGFGLSAIIVAALTLLLPPAEIVPIAILLEVTASILQAPGIWRRIDWRTLVLLLVGASAGNPVGVAGLVWLSADTARILIAFIIILASLLLLCGIKAHRASGTLASVGAGFVSGVANGLSALGGLPIALLLVARDGSPRVMRATMIGYFFLLDSYAGVLFAYQGLMTGEVAGRYATGLPLALAGLYIGGRQFTKSTPTSFRKIVFGLLIALSVIGLIKGAFGP